MGQTSMQGVQRASDVNDGRTGDLGINKSELTRARGGQPIALDVGSDAGAIDDP